MPELMKGKVWADYASKVEYPVLVEPKVDEIRVHVKVQDGPVLFLSYAGKPLANMRAFEHAFRCTALETGQDEFDCGVQVNGNFNDSYRWVRSTKGIPHDLDGARIVFTLYDCPGMQKRTYVHRRGALVDIAEALSTLLNKAEPAASAEVLPAYAANSEEEVLALYNAMRAEGHEGAMVKTRNHQYQRGKRTSDWLKMKPENDGDGVITGFVDAVCMVDQPELGLKKGDNLERVGAVVLWVQDDLQIVRPHGIPHALGRDMYKHPDKYLGQYAEFKYMERDRQGGYRHPVFHRLREAKA